MRPLLLALALLAGLPGAASAASANLTIIDSGLWHEAIATRPGPERFGDTTPPLTLVIERGGAVLAQGPKSHVIDVEAGDVLRVLDGDRELGRYTYAIPSLLSATCTSPTSFVVTHPPGAAVTIVLAPGATVTTEGDRTTAVGVPGTQVFAAASLPVIEEVGELIVSTTAYASGGQCGGPTGPPEPPAPTPVPVPEPLSPVSVTPAPRPAAPVAALARGTRLAALRRGRLALTAAVPGAGTVTQRVHAVGRSGARGVLLAAGRREVARAGTHTVAVRATRAGARVARNVATVRVLVVTTFDPAGPPVPRRLGADRLTLRR
jgi:hypothetical protein